MNSFNDEKIKIESSQLDNIYLNERNKFFSEIGIVSTLTLIKSRGQKRMNLYSFN